MAPPTAANHALSLLPSATVATPLPLLSFYTKQKSRPIILREIAYPLHTSSISLIYDGDGHGSIFLNPTHKARDPTQPKPPLPNNRPNPTQGHIPNTANRTVCSTLHSNILKTNVQTCMFGRSGGWSPRPPQASRNNDIQWANLKCTFRFRYPMLVNIRLWL